jgi:protease-4
MAAVTLLLAALVGRAPAEAPSWAELSPLSVADPGGFWATWLNPAALRVGNGDGLALAVDYTDLAHTADISDLKDNVSLFLNLSWLGYSYLQRDATHLHTLALSTRILRNLYGGAGVRFDPGSAGDPAFLLSGLFRPFDFLSLGAVMAVAVESDPQLQLGAGLRPFFFHSYLADRLTLTADIAWRGERWEKPLLAVRTELIDGLSLDTGFDFQRSAFRANLALSFGHLRTGSLLGLDRDHRFAGGQAYLHLSPNVFRPRRFGRITRIDSHPGPGDHFVDYRPGPRIVEQETGRAFGPFYLVSGGKTLEEVLQDIRRLAAEDTVAGILFRDHRLETSFAGFLEIEQALREYKAGGRKVVFYYELVDNLNFALAAAVGDRIYLHPQGYLDLRGFSVSVPYLKNLLASIGVEVSNFRSHPYKSAYNFLSEPEMTDEERETIGVVLQGQYRHLADMIREGRGARLARPVERLIDEGPYLAAQEALEAGLVDRLLYEDELPEQLRELSALSGPPDRLIQSPGLDLAEGIRYDWSDPPEDPVALIYATGSIHRGEGIPGASIGSQTLARSIREARENPAIKGIILRVDSPGGSALASDVIAREVALCREGPDAKPVVVSMGGMAASGGYYISAPASRIVAQPVTVTGSIGVVSLTANLEKLFEELLIHWDTVKQGERADMGALYRELTDEERQKIIREVQESYRTFLSLVARGRGLDAEEVDPIAQGRVWTGRQARERGLVDELGGLQTAFEVMKGLLGSGRPLKPVSLPRGGIPLPLEWIPFLLDREEKTPLPEIEELLDLYREYRRYRDERILMILPYRFKN